MRVIHLDTWSPEKMRRLPNTIALSLAVLTGAVSAALAQGMASLPPAGSQPAAVAPPAIAAPQAAHPNPGGGTSIPSTEAFRKPADWNSNRLSSVHHERYRSQPWHQCDGEQRAQSGAAGRENDCPLFDNGPRAESRRQRYGSSPGPLIWPLVSARQLLQNRLPGGTPAGAFVAPTALAFRRKYQKEDTSIRQR